MKILTKRGIAYCIDRSIILFCFAFFDYIIPLSTIQFALCEVLIEIVFFARDILFKNASIGKRIMGIEIYNLNWEVPKPTTLFLRSLLTNTVGILYMAKSKFVDGKMIEVIDFERDRCSTRVVEKRTLKCLSEEARMLDGEFNINLTRLYDEHLRRCYFKENDR